MARRRRGTAKVLNMVGLYRAIKRAQDNQFDAIIVFDGSRGLGKSTGAYKLCSKFEQFSPKQDIVFSREDINAALAKKKNDVILADEMINAGYKRDFWDTQQKDLIKMLNMYRDSCNIFVMCIPNFNDLDPALRNLVKMRVSVIKRGKAVVQMPVKSLYTNDPWDVKNNQKVEYAWRSGKRSRLNYTKLTTFRGILHYGDIGARQKRIYQKIKEEKRAHLLQVSKIESEDKDTKSLYDNLTRLAKQGKVDKEMLELVTMTNSKTMEAIKEGINRRLRFENSTKTLKDLMKPQEPKSNIIVNSTKETNSLKAQKQAFGAYKPKSEGEEK